MALAPVRHASRPCQAVRRTLLPTASPPQGLRLSSWRPTAERPSRAAQDAVQVLSHCGRVREGNVPFVRLEKGTRACTASGTRPVHQAHARQAHARCASPPQAPREHVVQVVSADCLDSARAQLSQALSKTTPMFVALPALY